MTVMQYDESWDNTTLLELFTPVMDPEECQRLCSVGLDVRM